MDAKELRAIAKKFKANAIPYKESEFLIWCPECCYMLPQNNKGHKAGCKIAKDLER